MQVGVFSKLGASGGSEHRCVEMCNSLLRYTEHRPVLLCEENLNAHVFARLDPAVRVVRNVFKPSPLNVSALYDLDCLIVVNSDSQSFCRLDYWEGRTKHHQATVDLARIPRITFLFNFVVSPAKHLFELVEKCPDVGIICANQHFARQIRENAKFQQVRILPRMVLESPIDPETVGFAKTSSTRIRIGKHSKAHGYKFNAEHPRLIERINTRFGDAVIWDFLGVPGDRARELTRFENVIVRPEYSIAVGDYLRNIDIFLFFISWDRQEPWSRAVAEGMTSGCPVLATACEGNSDQVEPDNTGYLCSSSDEFADGLIRLIERPELIQQMGRNAALAAKRFASRNVVSRLKEFIER